MKNWEKEAEGWTFFEAIAWGFITGVIVAVLYVFIALGIEATIVRRGYLTYRGKTYKVTLYDTLEKPVKENKL